MPPEVIGYLAASLTTLSFAPQAMQTLKTGDTKALSLLMYAMFSFGVLMWLFYGIMKGDWVIILANTLTELLALPILAIKVRNVITGRDQPLPVLNPKD